MIDNRKQYIILLGPSGTSKTYMLQQEAQKTFMIYILCNDGRTVSLERDSSFTSLRMSLDLAKTELERLELVYLFIISRILHLKLALEKAKKEGKELQPLEFYLMQLNGHSKNSQDLFDKIRTDHLEKYEKVDIFLRRLLKDIIEKYPYVKEKGVCFAIDEAGVANQLLKNQ